MFEKGIWNERPWKDKIYLGLQIEHFEKRAFLHQSTYTKIFLKRFYMDKEHILSTPIIVK